MEAEGELLQVDGVVNSASVVSKVIEIDEGPLVGCAGKEDEGDAGSAEGVVEGEGDRRSVDETLVGVNVQAADMRADSNNGLVGVGKDDAGIVECDVNSSSITVSSISIAVDASEVAVTAVQLRFFSAVLSCDRGPSTGRSACSPLTVSVILGRGVPGRDVRRMNGGRSSSMGVLGVDLLTRGCSDADMVAVAMRRSRA
jgi:hypothetical protein